MTAKILHFADVHLGQTNFGRIDSETGLSSRVLEFLEGLDLIADAAEEIEPDVILFAGDAFRSRTPNPSLLSHLTERFQRMANVAPVVSVIGNHDRQRGGSGKRHSTTILNEVTAKHPIIVEDRITTLFLNNDLYVITLPWFFAQDTTIEEVCDQLDTALAETDVDHPVILLGHCDVEGAIYHGTYGPSFDRNLVYPLDMLCDPEAWDYVALGHVHKYQVLCKDPPVVYAGSIDYVDWGERNDPKGFVTATVEPGSASWTFHNLRPRSLVEINVENDKHMHQMLKDYPVDGAIVRVNVHSKRHADRGKIMRIIEESLQGEYQLDGVNIHTDEEQRQREFAGRRLEEKEVRELVELYLTEKYPDALDWVDKCMKHADLIFEEEEE